MCRQTNGEGVTGGIAQALKGADVYLAFSTPGPSIITAKALRSMANDAIVLACTNPVSGIWSAEALAAGTGIVAAGRMTTPA